MSERKQPDERISRYLQWYSLRLAGEPEDRILHELMRRGLGEFASPRALYSRLSSDGFPVCRECGETPAGPGHCGTPKKRQPDLGGGRRIRLPDARDASALFRAALKELGSYIPLAAAEEAWLEGDVVEGVFKGKHFVTQWVERDAPEVARREDFTEEDWRQLCEERGADPASDTVLLSRGEAAPGGVERTPSALLVALIAAYSLANQPFGPLVGALHPDPDNALWKEIADSSDKLQKAAGHLAARVRGGTVERGRGVEEIPPEEHFLAWAARSLENRGASSDEEVLEGLKERFADLARKLDVEKVRGLKGSGLEPPG